jgi:PAS domain S-box-containing protein
MSSKSGKATQKTAKKTQGKSRADNVHLASFPEFNPNPVLELDAEGRINYLNPAARKRFPGLARQGKQHPFLKDWDALVNQIAGEKSRSLVRDVEVDDSWFEQSVAYLPSHGVFRIYARDITKRRQAENELRQTQAELEKRVRERTREIDEANKALVREIAERQRAEKNVLAERQQLNDVLETLPCYLVLLSPDYHVPYANRFFRERFGESHGRRCYEYLFDRTGPCEVCETYKVLQKMEPLEWEWVGPDGHNYYIYDFPFKNTDGSTLIMEVGIDVTGQKQALAELRKLHGELEIRVQERTAELKELNRLLRIKMTEHKEAEAREKRVAEEWQTTFDSITDMVSIQDKDCRLIRVNKAYADAVGMKPEELNGKKCYAVIHQTACPIEDCPQAETLKTRKSITQEMYEPKLGINLEVTTSPIFDEVGEMIGTVHIAKDITERKKADEALRESQHDLNRAQAVAHTGSWRLDVRRDELTWSEETFRMFGIPEGTPMTYETFLGAVHPADREGVNSAWQAALGGEPYDIEHRIIIGDSIKWVREIAELEFDHEHRLLGGFGTVQDITELKKADEELRESEERFRRFFENQPEYCYMVSPDSIVTNVNRAALKALGYAKQELVGRPLKTIYAPESQPKMKELFEIWKRTGVLENEELNIISKDGNRRTVLLSADALRNNEGKILYSVSIQRDITELKKVDKMKDEFIGLVSHELRTPLTVITGSLRTALSEGLSPAEIRELMQNAIEGADQLGAILENMLELSRHQSGHLKLRVEPVSISGTTRNVIKKLQGQRVSQQFTVEIPRDLPPVEADPVRVERILYNLLENAAKYSPDGSRVTVSAREEGSLIVTAVTDEGQGISPDDQPRIFEQFQQLDTTSRPIKGAGLGLVVCKRLVEAQGGWIKVDSAPGKGSTFSFALPVSPVPA